MSNRHGSREQKRLAKQKSKREAKRRQLALRNSPNPNIRLKNADDWPIVGCWVPENLWEIGLGNLLIARRAPDGQLACALFLVDAFCLGVKNAHWFIAPPGEFDAIRTGIEEHGRLEQVTPEYFAKLVYRAADYGQTLGFPPHRDFRHSQRLLAGIDPSQCADEFEFGRDGQPLYIRGPSESLDDARFIVDQLQMLGGDYIVPAEHIELIDTAGDEDQTDEKNPTHLPPWLFGND